MRIELGDQVISRDGHRLGKVKYLVLDPDTEQVKKIVVARGMLLTNDVEFALDTFVGSDSRGLLVSYTTEEADRLPHFDITLYTQADPNSLSELLENPDSGLLWPVGYMGQPYVGGGYPLMGGGFPVVMPADVPDEERRYRPDETAEVRAMRRQLERSNAVIAIGDTVLSQDGEVVGEVHSVTIDSKSGRPTALVVRKGHIFVEDTTLMADSIAAVDDGVVTLKIDGRELTGTHIP